MNLDIIKKNHCEKQLSFVNVIDTLIPVLLALCPILQHYKGIFINAAVSVLVIFFPYALYVLIKHSYKRSIDLSNIKIVLPLIVFFLYRVADHGTSVTELGQAVVFIVYLTVIASNFFNTERFMRAITVVSLAACACIVIQYFCYYILKFHLKLVPTSLLLPRCEQWVLLAKTGRYSITGKHLSFYRPSAFFLEPSHMFMYMFTPLTVSLLSSNCKRNKIIALILAIGMILTTSGMGIMTVLMLYVLYLGKMSGEDTEFSFKKLLQRENVIKLALLVVLGVVAYFCVPFVNSSIGRIFTSSSNYSNAVSGRLSSGWNVIKSLHGWQVIFGAQDGMSGITASMPSFNGVMLQFGIIGVILSYVFYVRGLFKLKNEYFWVAFIIVVASFFTAHTHSSFFILYAVFVFFNGYKKYFGE